MTPRKEGQKFKTSTEDLGKPCLNRKSKKISGRVVDEGLGSVLRMKDKITINRLKPKNTPNSGPWT